MDFFDRFEKNKNRQVDLIRKSKPLQANRQYNNELSELIERAYGYRKSFESGMSVDSDNDPIPWMTYSAVFYLSQFDLSHCDVFEWGAGNSTLYFSERAKTVTSVESDKNWFDYVSENRPSNVNLLLSSQDEYAEFIKKDNKKYDVIIIDGDIFRRFECAYYAVDALKDGGLIVLDNSDWLDNTTGFLRESGLIQVDFSGPGPINDYMWCTSVFIHRNFNLRKKKFSQPGFVIGGLSNIRD